MSAASTSVVTAEVRTQPVVKAPQWSTDEQVLAGIKQTWLELQNSDKSWEQAGRKFGKWCSELRKRSKNQGSRKGLGFEAAVKKLGVSFQKARYWADVVEGKRKAHYWGAAPTKKTKTTTDEKETPTRQTPFTMDGVSEAEQDQIVKAVKYHSQDFSRFIYEAAVEPQDKQVKYLVKRCLSCKSSAQEEADFLANVRAWIEGLQEEVKSGNRVGYNPKLSFLDGEDRHAHRDDLSKLLHTANEVKKASEANVATAGAQ